MLSLRDLEAEVNRRRLVLGLEARRNILYGESDDNATPHLEANAKGYHFVVQERGEVTRRVTSRDVEEIYYHAFDFITFGAACDWELNNRNEREDFRRALFARQELLMGRLSPAWAKRKKAEHAATLVKHPFRDPTP